MKSEVHAHRRFRHIWHWIIGLGALLWIVIRSGTDPKRLSYPCQQAAMPIAASWILSLTALLGGTLLLRTIARYSSVGAMVAAVVWFSLTSVDFTNADIRTFDPLPVWEVPNPISTLFVMDSIPPTIGTLAAGDSTVPNAYLRDPAIDTLLLMMAAKGIYLHNTAAHPNGIVHSNDVVIIKGNFQWWSRSSTSADRIKGLIRQILIHPSGFTGEIMVCDNTQGYEIDDDDNNSEDPNQSVVDVVNTFRAKGYPVSVTDWDNMFSAVASEYSTGDYNNGYVYEPATKISYPKFRTPIGRRYVSLKLGIWDSIATTYDPSRLCVVDFPTVKSHANAGATVAIKNWVGVMTVAYANERYGGWGPMHSTYIFGDHALPARVMSVTFPKLTIVDAAWTTPFGPNPQPNYPAVNTKMLLGTTDPLAVSWYAAKFILTPVALYPYLTNPDLPGSQYKACLDNWSRFLVDSTSLPCTKDSTRISVYDRGVLAALAVDPDQEHPGKFVLAQNYPNPFNSRTVIRYELGEKSEVRLGVYDVMGREVATLMNGTNGPGAHTVTWDATGMATGVYLYRLQAGTFAETKKLVLAK